MLDRF